MTELLQIDKALVALLLLVPGFIAQRVYDLIVGAPRRNWGEIVIEIFSYSLLNLPLVAVLLALLPTDTLPGLAMALFIGSYVFPSIEAVAWYKIRSARFLRGRLLDPSPTGWDSWFSQKKPCLVLFHLKDGAVVGGFCGDRSLASSHPQPQDIYVEQVWELDDQNRFVRPIEGTQGLIIRMDECSHVELLAPEGGDSGEEG